MATPTDSLSDARTGAAHARQGRLLYPLLYRLGFTPWDTGHIYGDLQWLIEGPDALPPGRALDLGCGTGAQSIYLASHGWRTTGVELVPRALAAASMRALQAGSTARFVSGDVARLDTLPLAGPFSLLLDIGCLHGLAESQRDAYIAGTAAVAAPGATFLLLAFQPGWRGPFPRGIAPGEVARRFAPAWDLIGWHRVNPAELPLPPRLAGLTAYTLTRRR